MPSTSSSIQAVVAAAAGAVLYAQAIGAMDEPAISPGLRFGLQMASIVALAAVGTVRTIKRS